MSERTAAVSRHAVIAVDGPSGSGKSTVSRAVARRLGWRYLDTGAMYRALTWLVLHQGLDPHDAGAVGALAVTADIHLTTDPDAVRVTVGSEDVSTAIREADVTGAVSAVSAVPEVRHEMVRRQRELIGAGRIVVEGRDIGTTVAPDAAVKVFLTATGDARALRRAREHHGPHVTDVSGTRAALDRRDAIDSGRSASPLVKANDAHEIDSTKLTVEQVVDRVLALLPAADPVR